MAAAIYQSTRRNIAEDSNPMDIPRTVHSNICNTVMNIVVQTAMVLTIDIQWGVLQRTVFISKSGMLQRKNATTNSFLSIKSGCYNERMLQRTVFINKIGMLQRMNATTNSFYQ